MKLGTLLKAGTLAVDIINHKSAQQLSDLVRSGVKRRADLYRSQTGEPAAKQPSAPKPYANSLYNQAMGPRQQGKPPAKPHITPSQMPNVPIKQAMKYVTPENMQKAMQWHGIIKSFFDKK